MSESSDPRAGGGPTEPVAPQPPQPPQPAEQLYPARPVGSPPPAPPPVSPGQYPPPGAYVGQPTNGLAIASLVLGILWLGWIGSVLAVIFGHVALRQISQSGDSQGGRGMAIAGLVLGWVGVAVLVGYLAIVVLGLLAAGAGA